jgi:hypothetical protein
MGNTSNSLALIHLCVYCHDVMSVVRWLRRRVREGSWSLLLRHIRAQGNLHTVKTIRQFGAILLLLVSCVAPAVACVAPDAQMTVEERVCCRMMKSQCGQMAMPISHSCCEKAPKSVSDSALKTDTASLHPAAFVGIRVASFEALAPQGASYGWFQRPQAAPPKFPPSAITILRI